MSGPSPPAPAPARLEARHLTRPDTGGLDVVTTLADFAIVTYAVEPEALRRHLAPGFEPDVRRLDDGREVALVSAVPFRDLNFRFVRLPFLRFAMGQTNYRAYVTRGGHRAVWFFGTSLTGPWRVIPRYLWRLPWHGARMRFDVRWDAERCVRYDLTTRSAWAPCAVSLEGTDAPLGRLDGFADAEDTLVVLTHPLDGYFHRMDGRVGRYSIWHAPLALRHARVLQARFPLFERLGLVASDQAPHSALVQRATEFVVRLPPRLA